MDYSKIRGEIGDIAKQNKVKSNFNPRMKRGFDAPYDPKFTDKERYEIQLNEDLSGINKNINIFDEKNGSINADKFKKSYYSFVNTIQGNRDKPIDRDKYLEALKRREERMIKVSMNELKKDYTPRKEKQLLEIVDFLDNHSITKDVGKKGLENAVTALSIGVILGSMFLLSPNLTGNTIAGLTVGETNLIGAGAFIVGILSASLTFK